MTDSVRREHLIDTGEKARQALDLLGDVPAHLQGFYLTSLKLAAREADEKQVMHYATCVAVLDDLMSELGERMRTGSRAMKQRGELDG